MSIGVRFKVVNSIPGARGRGRRVGLADPYTISLLPRDSSFFGADRLEKGVEGRAHPLLLVDAKGEISYGFQVF